MSKTPDIPTLASDSFTSASRINSIMDEITESFNNTLSRDGSTPNQMEADLDVNSNDVLNVGHMSVASLSVDESFDYKETPIDDYIKDKAEDYLQFFSNANAFIAYLEDNGDSVFRLAIESYNSLSDAIEASATKDVGGYLRVNGHTTPGDGGAFYGIIEATDSPSNPLGKNIAVLNRIARPRMFGLVGDGVVDDTAALTTLLLDGRPVDWGDGTYRVTAPVSTVLQRELDWQGEGATILFDPASHTEYALRLTDPTGLKMSVEGITVDGQKMANKVMEILNTTTDESTLCLKDVHITRAKRLNTFSGGNGLRVQGAFDRVSVSGGSVTDCELPAGQGSVGSIGISGIGVSSNGTTGGYTRVLHVEGARIEKIYSSDPSYVVDQDGIIHLVPDDPGGIGKVPSLTLIENLLTKNCYGRSIKTQTRDTQIIGSNFVRTEGPTSGIGNSEVSAQSGDLVVHNPRFTYSNGQTADDCVSASTSPGHRSAVSVTGAVVDLETGTNLPAFFATFPSGQGDPFTSLDVTANRINGVVGRFIDLATNGQTNPLSVHDNYLEGVSIDATTNERAMVYIRSSDAGAGTGTPYAHVVASGNAYGGTSDVHLMRARISGTSMDAQLSAHSNVGFLRDWTKAPAGAGPEAHPALAAVLRSADGSISSGYLGLQSATLADQDVVTFNHREANMSVIRIVASRGVQSQAEIAVNSAGITAIQSGSDFAFADSANPGTGNFNCWRSGPGEISIENDSGSTRAVTVVVLSPN